MKSVKKNYVMNMIYQVFLLIVPIAVTPYLSRILTDAGTGQYSYTSSIAAYFTLFAALGFGYYGQRLIASDQKEKKKQTIDFWSVFISRLIPVSLSLLIYLILFLCNVYGNDYYVLMGILSINVISVAFDITFFFQGNEEFSKIVIRNVIIKSISIALVFVLVKSKYDLWKYALLQSSTLLVSNLSLWLYLPKILCRVHLKELHPLQHLIPTFLLFIPTIAISIYTTLDKTLIGILVKGTTQIIDSSGNTIVKNLSDIENGNYEYSEKLVKMIMTVVTSLGTVMIPRNSNCFANNDMEGIIHNIYFSCRFVMLISIPMVLGCVCVASNLMPWYLGPGYTKASTLMQILSPLIFIIGMSNIFGLQFLIPTKRDKYFIISVTAGAFVNLILNFIFIPLWYSYGAAISTIIGELVVTTLCVVFSAKYINFGKVLIHSWKYFVSGAVMFVPCFWLQYKLDSSVVHTLIIVAVGVFVYFISLLVLRDSYFLNTIKNFFNKIRKKEKGEK